MPTPALQRVTRRGGVAHAAPRQQKETATTTSTSQAAGDQEDPAYKYSDGVNQFLGNFLPSNNAARDELDVDFAAPKLTGLSIDKLAALVEKGLSKTQWFVTGQVDAQLFSDTFAFKDESVATTGIKAYATGVRKLFDQASSKAELISVTADAPSSSIVVVWRLEGRVNLPFKPQIKPYVVTTTFGVDSQGLICSQLDEFAVPGWDLLLSTFLGQGFGGKPARPVEELRRAAAAGEKLQ